MNRLKLLKLLNASKIELWKEMRINKINNKKRTIYVFNEILRFR